MIILESFFGKPYIFHPLHNFDGTRGIYGNLDAIGKDPIVAVSTNGNTSVEIGLTPEAVEHSPVVFDLMVR